MRLLFVASLLAAMACKPNLRESSSGVLDENQPSRPDSGCAAKFSDPTLRDACEKTFVASYSKIEADTGPVITQQIRQLFGDPMTITVDGKCLSVAQSQDPQNPDVKLEGVHFLPCGASSPNEKWYLASMEAESTASGKPSAVRSKLFYLIHRPSVMKWLQTSLKSTNGGPDHASTKPQLRCVDMWEMQGRDVNKDERMPLRLSNCADTRLMFTTMSNWIDGDANHDVRNFYEVLVAFDLKAGGGANPAIASFRGEMEKRKPALTKACDHPGCISAANNLVDNKLPSIAQIKEAKKNLTKLVETPVNIGGLHWFEPDRNNTFLLFYASPTPDSNAELTRLTNFDFYKATAAKNIHMLVGGCVPQGYHEDKECFSDTEKAVPSFLSKSLPGAIIDRYQGPVIQLKDSTSRCATWKVGSRGCDDPVIDTADGDNSGQFRMVFVAPPRSSNDKRPRVKLQRVVNLTLLPLDQNGQGKQPEAPKCFSIRTTTPQVTGDEVACCDDSDPANQSCSQQQTYVFDEESEAIVALPADGSAPAPDRKFTFQVCVNASTNPKGLVYDCAIAPQQSGESHRDRLEKLAGRLGWVPVIGNIAQIAIYGMLCHDKRYDLQTHTQVCGELGIAIGTFIYSAACWGDSPITAAINEIKQTSSSLALNMTLEIFQADPLTAFIVKNGFSIAKDVMKSDDVIATIIEDIAKTQKQDLASVVATSAVRGSSQALYNIDSSLIFSDNQIQSMIDAAVAEDNEAGDASEGASPSGASPSGTSPSVSR